MIEEKYIELMNREIDGLLNQGESVELRRYLDRNPEANRYFDELHGVAQLLSQAEKLDPPIGLKREILSSLQAKERRHKTPFFDGLRLRFKSKYAYTFAVGIIAGICLYAVFNQFSSGGENLDMDSLYGTIAFESVKGKPGSTVSVEIDLLEVTGSAVFKYFDRAVVAQVKLRSDKEIEVLFEYPEELTFEVFKTLVSTDHGLQTENRELTVTNRGVSDFIIVFKEEAKAYPELHLKIVSAGNLLFEKTIQPGRN
jgi:hypothetical protein